MVCTSLSVCMCVRARADAKHTQTITHELLYNVNDCVIATPWYIAEEDVAAGALSIFCRFSAMNV